MTELIFCHSFANRRRKGNFMLRDNHLLVPENKIIIPPNMTLTKEDYNSLNLIQETNGVDINDRNVSEWIRCRHNPLYYIMNYVYFQEVGGRRKYDRDLMHLKFRRVIRSIFKYHMVILVASRQLGKSTVAAAILSWAANFFPSNRIVIFNFKKDAAQENLRKIKYINKNLPSWMSVPNLSKSDIKSYLELQNGSRVDTFYPSTTTPPDTLARSLSVPVLYVDEAAFIPHMDEIYGSAQPTLSTAREQAIRNDYPYMILMSSTPNGVSDTGKFFYDMNERAIQSDDLFVMNEETGLEDWTDEPDEIMSDPTKNSFIKIRYHWSENPLRTKEWYEQQKKELNFDQRKINQELDLLFVGSTNCIFDDDTLQRFIYVTKSATIGLKNQVKPDYRKASPMSHRHPHVDRDFRHRAFV